MKRDIVIVGGGSAGAACALYAASKGARTLLVDKARPDATGARWINGVERRLFAELELGEPPAGVVGEPLSRYVMIASGHHDRVGIPTPPTAEVDMRRLNAWLLGQAEKAGAELQFGARATIGEVSHSRREVRVGGQAIDAAVVIDARGFSKSLLQEHLHERDVCSAYQAVYDVVDPDAGEAWLHEHGVELGDNCSQVGVQGGFSLLNVTLARDRSHVAVLTGTIHKRGPKTGGQLAGAFVNSQGWVGKKAFGAGRLIPLRELPGHAVDASLIRVGDAAGQVFPAHGSGVANGIHAGVLAANAAAAAIQLGDTSLAGLWSYEVAYAAVRGAVSAYYQPFRYLSQGLSPSQTAVLLRAGLISEPSVRAGMDIRYPTIDPTLAFGALPYAFDVLPILPKFLQVLSLGDQLKRHYKHMPRRYAPADCAQWFRRRERLLDRAAALAQ